MIETNVSATPGLTMAIAYRSGLDLDQLMNRRMHRSAVQCSSAEWVLFMRGLGREWSEPDGEIVGERTTEVQLRGIYKEWKRLMQIGVQTGKIQL